MKQFYDQMKQLISFFYHCPAATAMVDALASKILAWENERGIDFMYDGVSAPQIQVGNFPLSLSFLRID